MSLLKLVKYILTLFNQQKKLTKKLTRKNVIDDISNELLKLEFKSSNSVKTKCLRYVVTKVLPVL